MLPNALRFENVFPGVTAGLSEPFYSHLLNMKSKIKFSAACGSNPEFSTQKWKSSKAAGLYHR